MVTEQTEIELATVKRIEKNDTIVEEVEEEGEQREDKNYMDTIQEHKRSSIMFKILASIIIDDKCKTERLDSIEITQIKSNTNIYEEKKVYSIR
jgi:hypothetical protein